jgi:hypothetical protein
VENGVPHDFSPNLDGDFGCLAEKLTRFGSGPWERLYRGGPHGDLVGRAAQDQVATVPATISARLHDPGAYRDVSTDSTFVPARVQGSVRETHRRDAGVTGTVGLAVAVNGVVRATTAVSVRPGAEARWEVMVPEEAFRAGANEVEVYEVVAGGLARATAAPSALAALTFEWSGGDLRASDGRVFAVRRHTFEGYLDIFHANESCVTFAGWAADPRRKELPERIILMADDRFVYGGPLNAERADVARVLKDQRYRAAGFNLCLPRERFRGLEDARFRLFALSADGRASELGYHDWFTRHGQKPFRR